MFDPPFYKCIFEINNDDNYSVASVNMGTSEPNDLVIYNFILKNYSKISFYKVGSEQIINTKKKINPKRLQRIARKQVNNEFQGTKAQKTLQKQHELIKKERKKKNSKEKDERRKIMFKKKQAKKKEKHKGR
ncbi:YjdF family protein [Fructilactobacillus florum]|uniref:YjdF family protein n=1 Tax=Fructilactobacillus florum TaxID=640331 RepID=UPI002287253B|nr:YjdF family protein [Fructilactobacillus florum]